MRILDLNIKRHEDSEARYSETADMGSMRDGVFLFMRNNCLRASLLSMAAI
jgi:hypothetical protein